MSGTLVVNEIYLSLQGESTFAGLPCIFVRLTGCDLRCSYCDTAYAFGGGKKRSLAQIRAEVRRLARPFGAIRSRKAEVRSQKAEARGIGGPRRWTTSPPFCALGSCWRCWRYVDDDFR